MDDAEIKKIAEKGLAEFKAKHRCKALGCSGLDSPAHLGLCQSCYENIAALEHVSFPKATPTP